MTSPAPKPIADCPNPECGYAPIHICSMNNVIGDATCGCTYWASCLKCGYQGPKALSEDDAANLHNLIARPQQSAEPVAWQLLKDGENCGITTDAEIRDSWPIEIKGASVRELFAASPGPSELVEEMEKLAEELREPQEKYLTGKSGLSAEHVAVYNECADRLSVLITRHRGKS